MLYCLLVIVYNLVCCQHGGVFPRTGDGGFLRGHLFVHWFRDDPTALRHHARPDCGHARYHSVLWRHCLDCPGTVPVADPWRPDAGEGRLGAARGAGRLRGGFVPGKNRHPAEDYWRPRRHASGGGYHLGAHGHRVGGRSDWRSAGDPHRHGAARGVVPLCVGAAPAQDGQGLAADFCSTPGISRTSTAIMPAARMACMPRSVSS